jgi:hypothetical protein
MTIYNVQKVSDCKFYECQIYRSRNVRLFHTPLIIYENFIHDFGAILTVLSWRRQLLLNILLTSSPSGKGDLMSAREPFIT